MKSFIHYVKLSIIPIVVSGTLMYLAISGKIMSITNYLSEKLSAIFEYLRVPVEVQSLMVIAVYPAIMYFVWLVFNKLDHNNKKKNI